MKIAQLSESTYTYQLQPSIYCHIRNMSHIWKGTHFDRAKFKCLTII